MSWIPLLWRISSTLPTLFCLYKEITFIGDKGYDAKAVYNRGLVKDVYEGEAAIPLNKRRTKDT